MTSTSDIYEGYYIPKGLYPRDAQTFLPNASLQGVS